MDTSPYTPDHPVRFVTATSLFDGHDAAINIMRRILQATGVEVIHLGHNRAVQEIVDTAIQEDAQGIAVSSYQGGHMEYFTYMYDLLQERDAGHIQIFGGGGGVIVPEEIEELEAYGIAKIFSPEDGMAMGLQGMINAMVEACDYPIIEKGFAPDAYAGRDARRIARLLSRLELAHGAGEAVQTKVAAGGEAESATGGDGLPEAAAVETSASDRATAPVLGITGTGGAGKSTLTDELVRHFLNDFDDLELAILSVDPTRRRTGGALLGDRIRMNAIYGDGAADRVYMRSFATRQAHRSTSEALKEAIGVCQAAGFDLILLETAGIGQSDTEIVDLTDASLYVMTHDFGAPTQLEKIGMLDLADFVALNKFEKRGSQDALRDVRKQVQRNRLRFDEDPADMPVYPTMASHFGDPGVTRLYQALLEHFNEAFDFDRRSTLYADTIPEPDPAEVAIIPPDRQRYLGEIVEACQDYRAWAEQQVTYARKWGEAKGARAQVDDWAPEDREHLGARLDAMVDHWWAKLDARCQTILSEWDQLAADYQQDEFTYTVRGRDITVPLYKESLSGTKIPRVALPTTEDPGERLAFALLENLPGYYPFTAGVYPFKRTGEDPTRMFAGEGSPERTNRRFHLVSEGTPANRLSTAFDSVTLYGFDPDERPDIYGKVGNAGVSVCTLDDMKKLYSGFDLADRKTSVSMTINGPAPMILAMFLQTAIDQQVEKHLKDEGRWDDVDRLIDEKLGDERPSYVPYGPNGREDDLPPTHDGSGLGLLGCTGAELVEWGALDADTYARIRDETLHVVRGTVQADILKEDQAQNTCIFSTDFALRMMGDIQQSFIDHDVRNFYSVSISGYHIAEAGANPITQLAFTLANGFTYVEYYLSRGMDIDDFAPNLSFFFSNGMDPEYSVIGRVARRIWAVAMREKYGANERSQKLKYHIQTSGRSLHAKEIQFNDIRTTLQALYAIYDNCNSLHTNAYDEAITTPTEESVRRAIAIQMIINKELGTTMNENPLQGSFIFEELTDLVEEAVLHEFQRINERGGVLGAMESMYQRGKIQQESMHYEEKKHSGERPIIGVNTFTRDEDSEQPEDEQVDLMRSSDDEKQHQLRSLRAFQQRYEDKAADALDALRSTARAGGNTFDVLMDAVKYCSLGQITDAFFEVGGRYRRNM
ncbi:methylmalonyl-CoA mutase family protein [Salisaeta longa]|uniref:methylmalonyl-CoA mutase family protein n=1 Tax=Salisaeta longa TaxID=503170 RepID=UPI0003B46857|nr:methylmalonyl-CoA mutase family protein [Salisaeta longa]